MSELVLRQNSRGNVIRLRVTGEIDMATTPRLGSELARLERRHGGLLILDLSEVTFVDVAGVELMLSLASRARHEGFEYLIVEPSDGSGRVFDVAGVRDKLKLTASEQRSDESADRE